MKKYAFIIFLNFVIYHRGRGARVGEAVSVWLVWNGGRRAADPPVVLGKGAVGAT